MHWQLAADVAKHPGLLPAHFWSAFLGEAGSLTFAVAVVVAWRLHGARRRRTRRPRRLATGPFELEERIDQLNQLELDPHDVSRN